MQFGHRLGRPARIFDGLPARVLGDEALEPSPTLRFGARPRHDAEGDSVQPAHNCCAVPDRARAPSKHQERRLEGIIRVMAIVRQRSAEPPYHSSVPFHEDLERRLRVCFITVSGSLDEPVEELFVGQSA
jgi:hypothetical protein